MLELHTPKFELYDDESQTFITVPEQHLTLEHSLVAISKWESTHHKPFMVQDDKTDEEIRDYVRCMTVGPPGDEDFYRFIPGGIMDQIIDYMNDPYTATTIRRRDAPHPKRGEIITSEIIYYWMIASNIPIECENWHLNRLLTLVEVCGIKNSPPKKMGKQELRQRNTALNAARRARLNSKG